VYDAAHRGANPTWLEFSSGGVSLTYFKEFDTKDGFSQAITIDSSYLENVVASTPTFRFDASGSYDMDGEIVSYEWDFGDGTVAQGIAAEYIYTAPGTYEVTLTVTDDDGLASTVSVMVTYAVPVTIQPLPGPSKSSF
jgi:PKD repeat protein